MRPEIGVIDSSSCDATLSDAFDLNCSPLHVRAAAAAAAATAAAVK